MITLKNNSNKIIKRSGKIIGELVPARKIFKKEVKLSRHLMFAHDGWAIDAELLEDFLLPKGYLIQIWDKEEDVLYFASAKRFIESGVKFNYGSYGRQYCLARQYFDKRDRVNKEVIQTALL